MAWAFVAAGTGKVVEGTDPSLDMTGLLPTGSGGVLLAILTCRTAPTSVATPANWAKIVNNVQGVTVFAYDAASADDAPTIVVTGASQTSHCFLSRWTGGNTTFASLLDGTVQSGTTGTVNYIAARAITPSVDNCLVIRGGRVNDDIGVVTGQPNTLLFTQNINVVSDVMVGYEYVIQTTAAEVAAGQLTTGGANNSEYSVAFALTAAATGPAITDVNTDEALSPGETATITGTGFGATQGAGGVKLTQEAGALESALTITAWSDTEITGTVALGGLSYGATTSLVVTDNAAATGSIAVTFVPATGYSYVTLSGYPGTGYVIGEDASPAVVDGDQVEYESTASSGAGVTVNADGTFVLDTTDPGYFDYRVRDNTDNTWSSWSTIYVNIPSSATVPTTTGGTDFTSAGKMQTIFVNDSTDVPATAIMCNGFAHHADGRRYVALWPSNYDVYYTWNGIAVREDGAMIIATSGDIVESSMGIALTYRGEVRAGTATPDVIYNTVGLTSAGVLCMTAVS